MERNSKPDAVTVLYVGSDAAGRERRVADLEDAGVRVLSATSGIDGIKRLQSRVVDCVVTAGAPSDVPLQDFRSRVHDACPGVPILVVGDVDRVDGEPFVASLTYLPTDRALADAVDAAVQRDRVDAALDDHRTFQNAIFSIVRSASAASTREAVEQQVYANLSELDRYAFVWLGEYERDTDTIQLRVPTSGTVSAEEFATHVGCEDATFVSRAIETGSVTSRRGSVTPRGASGAADGTGATTEGTGPAVDRTGPAGGGPTAPAQPALSQESPMTTTAVPLVHEDAVSGILILATHGARDDRAERSLLADLGRTIGRTIHRIENADAPAQETFASMVVHELKNPVAIAQGYLELARETGDLEKLQNAEQALEQLDSILTNELALLRGDDLQELAVGALSDDASAAWESVVTNGAELRVDGSLEFRADHDLAVRLLANLFDNALTHGGDEVTVRVGALDAGFYVEDDGQGIPPEERDRIFDRRYSNGAGTGLGLAIVDRIATAHDWDVTVTDSERGGARFEITGVDTAGD